jgi:hypothetical protein
VKRKKCSVIKRPNAEGMRLTARECCTQTPATTENDRDRVRFCVAQSSSSRKIDRVQSSLCTPAFRCCAPRVSLSREQQAQPLNFPRLLSGFCLGSSRLDKRHGGRWRALGCAGMLEDARGGLTGEWFWAGAHLSYTGSTRGAKKGAPRGIAI